MKKNQYLPPTVPQPTFLRDLPKEERRKLVLAGDTTAGPLVVLMYKHPTLFAIGVFLATAAFLVGCWTVIQM